MPRVQAPQRAQDTLAAVQGHPEPESSPRTRLPGRAGLSDRSKRVLLRFSDRCYHVTGKGYRHESLALVTRIRAKPLFDAGLVTISQTMENKFIVILTYEGALAVQAIRKSLYKKPMIGHSQPRAPNYGQLSFNF